MFIGFRVVGTQNGQGSPPEPSQTSTVAPCQLQSAPCNLWVAGRANAAGVARIEPYEYARVVCRTSRGCSGLSTRMCGGIALWCRPESVTRSRRASYLASPAGLVAAQVRRLEPGLLVGYWFTRQYQALVSQPRLSLVFLVCSSMPGVARGLLCSYWQ